MKSDKTPRKKCTLVKGLAAMVILLSMLSSTAAAGRIPDWNDAKTELGNVIFGPPENVTPNNTNTIPEFSSYAVPVVGMLGIFFILGYRKND